MEVSLGVAGLLRVLEVSETETAKCHSYAEKKSEGVFKRCKVRLVHHETEIHMK